MLNSLKKHFQFDGTTPIVLPLGLILLGTGIVLAIGINFSWALLLVATAILGVSELLTAVIFLSTNNPTNVVRHHKINTAINAIALIALVSALFIPGLQALILAPAAFAPYIIITATLAVMTIFYPLSIQRFLAKPGFRTLYQENCLTQKNTQALSKLAGTEHLTHIDSLFKKLAKSKLLNQNTIDRISLRKDRQIADIDTTCESLLKANLLNKQTLQRLFVTASSELSQACDQLEQKNLLTLDNFGALTNAKTKATLPLGTLALANADILTQETFNILARHEASHFLSLTIHSITNLPNTSHTLNVNRLKVLAYLASQSNVIWEVKANNIDNASLLELAVLADSNPIFFPVVNRLKDLCLMSYKIVCCAAKVREKASLEFLNNPLVKQYLPNLTVNIFIELAREESRIPLVEATINKLGTLQLLTYDTFAAATKVKKSTTLKFLNSSFIRDHLTARNLIKLFENESNIANFELTINKLKAAKLLTQDDFDGLVDHLQHATEFSLVVSTLEANNLLTEGNFDSTVEHKDHIGVISSIINKLATAKSLTQTNLDLLFSHIAVAGQLDRACDRLRENNNLSNETFSEVIKAMEDTLDTVIFSERSRENQHVNKSPELPTPSKAQLDSLPEQTLLTANEFLKSLEGTENSELVKFWKFADAVRLLAHYKQLTAEAGSALIQFEGLIDLILQLEQKNLLSNQICKKLIAQAKNSWILLDSYDYLNERFHNLLTKENFSFLISHAKHAGELSVALAFLEPDSKLTDTQRTQLGTHAEKTKSIIDVFDCFFYIDEPLTDKIILAIYDNIDHAADLADICFNLSRCKMFRRDIFEAVVQKNCDIPNLFSICQYLYINGLLKQNFSMSFIKAVNNPQTAPYLAKSCKRLYEHRLLTSGNFRTLVKHVQDIFYIAKELDDLNATDKLTQNTFTAAVSDISKRIGKQAASFQSVFHSPSKFKHPLEIASRQPLTSLYSS